jgi:penicillin-binding protein 1A
VRDGLQTYDRAHDGYHGPVAHVDDPDLAAHWTKDLAHQSTPPGMRADWQLGMVLTAGGPSARIGTIDRATGP